MKSLDNSIIVIFGGTGDLTQRKIVPALYQNYKQGMLPKEFVILGLGRSDFSMENYREKFVDQLKKIESTIDPTFLDRIKYQKMDVNKSADFNHLATSLVDLDKRYNTAGNYLFYLAVGPNLFQKIVKNLANVGLTKSKFGWKRLIIEKPFGYDLKSAQELNRDLLSYFDEQQIFRIDHYLGKETVQNILAFRFANGIFEPLWNRNYIDHIEITGSESDGVGSRGGYYDKAGVLRDMVQNHLLQLLSIVAMEPPNSFQAKAVRDEKVKIFEALCPINPRDLGDSVIRGQYTRATINDQVVKGYREEEKISRQSQTETFVAMKVFIDNWRWSGVPFYIRTGKRLPARVNEIVIHFKQTPHHLFKNMSMTELGHNKLILRIQPDEGIVMSFGMKKPGEGFHIKKVNMNFHYSNLTSNPLPDAYERLLLDVLAGDPTLYARNDAVEACWRFITPILEAWQNSKDIPLYFYSAGSWGPEAAKQIFENTKSKWHNPCQNLTEMGDNCEL